MGITCLFEVSLCRFSPWSDFENDWSHKTALPILGEVLVEVRNVSLILFPGNQLTCEHTRIGGEINLEIPELWAMVLLITCGKDPLLGT